jgi:predicted ATP-grasp superfamily ATP-dependent carboligase
VRILVHEFVTGGGCAGRDVSASLAQEGLAMRTALVADLAAMGSHTIVTTTDVRFAGVVPPGVEVVTFARPGPLGVLVDAADAVWLVATETGGCLERLAAFVEGRRKILLGPSASAVARASDKAKLPRRLGRLGVPHPRTVMLQPGTDARVVAERIGYPVVVKPRRGAGSQGVRLARNSDELLRSLDASRGFTETRGVASTVSGGRDVIIQRYVAGTPASITLLADGRRAVALVANAQEMELSPGFVYRGGSTPLDHPDADAASAMAIRACEALPGLRGYVGVDIVLSDAGPVVIEVNPRLTTAYLGVRSALDENIAALALAACQGMLPTQLVPRRRVRFSPAGLVAAA